MIGAEVAQRVTQLIGQTCLDLDAERFDAWLGHFDAALEYTIVAHSPEIRREMVWLELDRPGLEHLCRTLPTHARDPGALHRHPSLLTLKEDGGIIVATSSVLVVRTAPAGTSTLFAAAHYHDRIVRQGDQLRIAARRVVLGTRMLVSDSGGSHVPI